MKRKYFTEFAVNMFGTYRLLLQQDSLSDPNMVSSLPEVPFHIYMIGRRPRIGFDATTFRFLPDTVSGVFTIQRGAHFERHEFTTRNMLGTHEVEIVCPYPNTEYAIHDGNGKRIAGGKVALALSGFSSEFWKFMDLEILYIGQAYGDDGSRVAPDRLKSHETLQSIYVEALRRSPDKEIWIVLWSFAPLLVTSFDGRTKEFQTSQSEDAEHSNRVLDFDITEQQRINFTEAALIRYFRPEYNVVFEDSFPNPAHRTYAQCYDLDLNAICVELQTEEIGTRLWSPAVPPQWIHIAQFELHSRADRVSIFDLA